MSNCLLVRSGISGSLDLTLVPEGRRRDVTIDTVAELLPWL